MQSRQQALDSSWDQERHGGPRLAKMPSIYKQPHVMEEQQGQETPSGRRRGTHRGTSSGAEKKDSSLHPAPSQVPLSEPADRRPDGVTGVAPLGSLFTRRTHRTKQQIKDNALQERRPGLLRTPAGRLGFSVHTRPRAQIRKYSVHSHLSRSLNRPTSPRSRPLPPQATRCLTAYKIHGIRDPPNRGPSS